MKKIPLSLEKINTYIETHKLGKKVTLLAVSKNETIKHMFVLYFMAWKTEGEPSTASVTLLNHNQEIIDDQNVDYYVLLEDSEIVFCGKITEIEKSDSTIEIFMNEYITSSLQPEKASSIEMDAEVAKLLYNNEDVEKSEIFTNLNVQDADGNIISILEEGDNVINDIERSVLKNSLKIEKDHAKVVGEINVDISASWVSVVEGDIEISAKIANRFEGNKISTLTPIKLESSWPKFGDRLICQKQARPTRYYIGFSKLTRDEELLHMPPTNLSTLPLVVADDVVPFSLKRHWYNHKLSICFGYDQLRKESIRTKIINPAFNGKGKIKNISINLRSVQDFLPNTYTQTFFKTKIGEKAYIHIMKLIEKYIILSLRNIEITFTIPYRKNLSTKNWVKIGGYIAKITNLEINNAKEIKVTAMAFCDQNLAKNLKIPVKPLPEKKPKAIGDIIRDIVVENDGFKQTDGLIKYIAQLKSESKINKSNYKKMINKFLNENNTRITIITKPLKTENCIYNVINI
ncbi:MAG: hypothetical protein LBI26_03010 [Holosporales bacterium]|jgi:hypothetical protein|nr:hypothetical protein [Holosporales bacterium]